MSSRITIQKIDEEKEKDPPNIKRMGFIPWLWEVLDDWQLLIIAAFCIMIFVL